MQTLIQIIPPALAVSFIVYLSVFFGKIINDQKPFVDSRKWDIELSGLSFTIELFWAALLAYGLAMWWNFSTPTHFWGFAILSIIGAFLLIANKFKSEEIYQIKLPDLLPLKDKDTDNFLETFARIFNSFAFLPLFAIVLFYIPIVFFRQGNLWWFSVILVQVFLNFIFLAINYSLRRTKLPKADIHFINTKKKPLKDVLLIKVNDDNIRVRVKDKIILINKGEIFQIEIPVDEKFLPVSKGD